VIQKNIFGKPINPLVATRIVKKIFENKILCSMLIHGNERQIHNTKMTELFSNITYNRSHIDSFLTRTKGYTVGTKSFSYKFENFNIIQIAKTIKDSDFLFQLPESFKKELAETPKFMISLELAKRVVKFFAQNRYYDQEINDFKTGTKIIYKEAANREFHKFQNASSEFRDIVFSQYLPHTYDINNCYYSVLTEHSRHLLNSGYRFTNKRITRVNLALQRISDYLENKDFHRQRLAELIHVDVKNVKKLLLGVANGMRINPTKYSPAFKNLLDENESKYYRLTSDPFFQSLKSAVRQLWDFIYYYRQKVLELETPSSKRERSTIYFQEEQKIRNCFQKYVNTIEKSKFYNEHDGFRCNVEIMKSELEQYVKEQIDYGISVSYKDLSGYLPKVLT
jgi:hypothetical protein